MTQNIYDDAGFFKNYSQLPRSTQGLAGAPEWPKLRALLPPLAGMRVLDLGCGFGWFARWARENGAAHVVGVDISDRMLARARRDTEDQAIEYFCADLERYVPAPGVFDLVYSSLAFHYLENLDRLLADVHNALVPGGRLVFSVEHPLMTAPANPGWSTDSAGRSVWPVEGYLDEGLRSTDWLAEGVIKRHRTIGTYLNLLIRVGFSIRNVEEWGPSLEQVVERPDWKVERERPMFLLVDCEAR